MLQTEGCIQCPCQALFALKKSLPSGIPADRGFKTVFQDETDSHVFFLYKTTAKKSNDIWPLVLGSLKTSSLIQAMGEH